MTITIELDQTQTDDLRRMARVLRVDEADLARAAIGGFLSRPDDDFAEALELVVAKNRELYRRLA